MTRHHRGIHALPIVSWTQECAIRAAARELPEELAEHFINRCGAKLKLSRTSNGFATDALVERIIAAAKRELLEERWLT